MATQTTSILLEEGFRSGLETCPEALSSLYTAYYPHVLNVCRRFFRRPEDAEDAAAEVFLKLHTVLDKKDEEHPFRPWVCQVAGRHCIDKLRRRKRENCSIVAGNDLCAFPDSSTPSPLSQILHKEAKRRVREGLNCLPEYYKVPLMLRYYKRMSYSEIARTLNRGLPAVKTIIFRAKNSLRRNLRRSESLRPTSSHDRQTSITGSIWPSSRRNGRILDPGFPVTRSASTVRNRENLNQSIGFPINHEEGKTG